MTYLLDVNVLIALIDPGHVTHDAAHQWFASTGSRDWATCPLTENGVLRIVANPKYPNSPGSPAAVAPILSKLRRLPGHQFWSDDIRLDESAGIDTDKLLTANQVTDCYLLALAKAHEAQLAAFDRRLSVAAVRGGKAALYRIGSD